MSYTNAVVRNDERNV